MNKETNKLMNHIDETAEEPCYCNRCIKRRRINELKEIFSLSNLLTVIIFVLGLSLIINLSFPWTLIGYGLLGFWHGRVFP